MRLNEMSRLVPRSFGFDDFEQSYAQLNFGIKNVFLTRFDVSRRLLEASLD